MHAATVIQKSQRAASKKALTTELKGQLYKRSNMTPRFQRRWFYVVGDAAGNHALCYRVGDVDGSGGGEEKRIPVASITAVEIDNEMRYAPRNSGAILAQFWRNSGAMLAQFCANV